MTDDLTLAQAEHTRETAADREHAEWCAAPYAHISGLKNNKIREEDPGNGGFTYPDDMEAMRAGDGLDMPSYGD